MKKYPDKQLLKDLSIFQRVLLITDGTVTELLEQYLGEAIKVVKLDEGIKKELTQLPHLHQNIINSNDHIFLRRETLLQGQQTLNNWLYAESTIVVNNLAPDFRRDLLESHEPIGKLWSKYRCETYKTIVDARKECAGNLAKHFNIQATDEMISRTYSVYSNKQIIMIITEKFPSQFFRGEFL